MRTLLLLALGFGLAHLCRRSTPPTRSVPVALDRDGTWHTVH
jgi:hypothetical protein